MLSQMAARRIRTYQPSPYADLNEEQLAALFPPQLEQAANYERTGNLEDWLAFSQSILRDRIQHGYSVEEIKIAIDSIFMVTGNLLKQKFAGPENKTIREKYLRRLASIKNIQEIRLTLSSPKTRIL